MKKTEVITFRRYEVIHSTLVFEELFKPSLRLSLKDKIELMQEAEWKVWMYVNGVLMGETYAVRLSKANEKYEGCESFPKANTAYVYSMAITPLFQGRGLGKILKAHLLGMIQGQDWSIRYIVGHAYEGASIALAEHFGAIRLKEFKNWYKTGRSVFLYCLNV